MRLTRAIRRSDDPTLDCGRTVDCKKMAEAGGRPAAPSRSAQPVASMPPKDFPVSGDRHVPEPRSFTDIDRSGRSANASGITRMPWRPVSAFAASLGASAGVGLFHPVLGEVIAAIEIAMVLAIIATALFGSQTLSERAFRLLRWFGNRPEPPAPGDGHGA
jgi:hypothetical protein